MLGLYITSGSYLFYVGSEDVTQVLISVQRAYCHLIHSLSLCCLLFKWLLYYITKEYENDVVWYLYVFLLEISETSESLKTKMSELRLYCDLLMQQVHTVQEFVHHDEKHPSPSVEVLPFPWGPLLGIMRYCLSPGSLCSGSCSAMDCTGAPLAAP